jgi:hypothetical protein
VSQSIRRIPADGSPATIVAVFVRLGHDLVALARDMRCGAEVIDWLTSEIDRAVARLPPGIDTTGIKAAALDALQQIPPQQPPIEPRDLFLVYVPEDRLPIAAPLAVELSKRRVTVAVAGFEVANGDDLDKAVDTGLRHHRRGVLLRTVGFDRRGWTLNLPETDRFRVLRDSTIQTLVAEVLRWLGPARI